MVSSPLELCDIRWTCEGVRLTPRFTKDELSLLLIGHSLKRDNIAAQMSRAEERFPEVFSRGYVATARTERQEKWRKVDRADNHGYGQPGDRLGGRVPTSAILQWVFRFPRGATAMTLTVEAIYENGVLKPLQPLPLKEHEKVRITVKAAVSHVRRSAGLIGWTGSQEDADFVALSPELDPLEDA